MIMTGCFASSSYRLVCHCHTFNGDAVWAKVVENVVDEELLLWKAVSGQAVSPQDVIDYNPQHCVQVGVWVSMLMVCVSHVALLKDVSQGEAVLGK